MNNADMSQYLDVFLDEGREQLVLLETNILAMERGNHTTEMLQVLFRAAHTLKGSSRAMGFLAVGDLTHEMENILDDLRNDKLDVGTPIVNALLSCLDALGHLVDIIGQTGSDVGCTDKDIPALVALLRSLRTDAPIVAEVAPGPVGSLSAEIAHPFKLASHELTAVEAAKKAGLSVFQISIKLVADCLMKSVRVWMVLGALEPVGTLLASEPNEDKLEAEEFDVQFRLLFATGQPEELVLKTIKSVSEVESCELSIWSQSNAEEAPVVEVEATVAPPPAPGEPVEKLAIAGKAAAVQSQTIRVEVSRLDTLLNLVGELVIERSQVHQICAELHRRYPRDEEAKDLLETTHRIARVTAELQDQIMKTRLLPIDGVFQRMPRMVRDLAQKTGKLINFEMTGGETELDRTVLESLADPLIHLLRNSLDHGIETPDKRTAAGKSAEGSVILAARHEENRIVIEITDDGAGMDPNKLKEHAVEKGTITQATASGMSDKDALGLIFASGFSTAATLTDISGRGVGMDIVRSNLEKVGGRITVESVRGKGSVFTIHLPMTLAILRAVLVQSSGGTYVLPLGNIVEMLRIGTSEEDREMRELGGQPVISLRGRTIPLSNLTDLLGNNPRCTASEDIPDEAFVVVVGIGNRQIGLCVDELVGEQEVVIKSMGTLLGDIPGLSGATILGDGRVALIVDVSKVTERIQSAEWIKKEVSSVK
jgi:two-component system chemotaxis sensor kinase CheA